MKHSVKTIYEMLTQKFLNSQELIDQLIEHDSDSSSTHSELSPKQNKTLTTLILNCFSPAVCQYDRQASEIASILRDIASDDAYIDFKAISDRSESLAKLYILANGSDNKESFNHLAQTLFGISNKDASAFHKVFRDVIQNNVPHIANTVTNRLNPSSSSLPQQPPKRKRQPSTCLGRAKLRRAESTTPKISDTSEAKTKQAPADIPASKIHPK